MAVFERLATADGTKTPYWEMNVRLKTDTSKFSPLFGKPATTPIRDDGRPRLHRVFECGLDHGSGEGLVLKKKGEEPPLAKVAKAQAQSGGRR